MSDDSILLPGPEPIPRLKSYEWHRGFHVRRNDGRIELLARIDVDDEQCVKTVLCVDARLAMEIGDMLRLAGWNEMSEEKGG